MTRESQYVDLEQVRYMTHVTYQSLELRKAYVEEYATRYQLSDEKKSELLQKEMEDASQFESFFVSHYSTNRKAMNLSGPKVWRLALSTQPSSLPIAEPSSIATLSSGDPVEQYFHPYITTWSKNYIVKFKREGESNYFKLNMSGVVAQLSFTWQLP